MTGGEISTDSATGKGWFFEPTIIGDLHPEDPAVQLLGAKVGDVLKIKRNSPTAGEFLVYRTVVP